MTRPIRACVYPKALTHNLNVAQKTGKFTWAVVKANAYGHGIERIYSGLAAADGLAMLDFAEARLVRALGWSKPILMLEGVFDADDVKLCQPLDLTLVTHSFRQLQWLIDAKTPFNIFCKINSGMNRLGFALHDLPTLGALLAQHPQLKVASWMTHFANADLPQGANVQQIAFEQAIKELRVIHPDLPASQAPFSLSNSAAIMNLPSTHAASVRAGVMLYGASPFADVTAKALGLRPVMQLQSELIALQNLVAGQAVGYGSTFTAPHPMRIGVVACGYADGYPRHAPTGTPIAVEGIRTRVVGRVSMVMLAVDLTPVPHAQMGSTVELWGDFIPIDEVAAAAGTIGYELMCALAQRVPVQIHH